MTILNHFSPLERTTLTRWLGESHLGKKFYHRAFAQSSSSLSSAMRSQVLDLRTKITFSVISEFGHHLECPTAQETLVQAVEAQIERQVIRPLS